MKLSTSTLLIITLVCFVGIIAADFYTANYTGHGVYEVSDAKLNGVNIAGTADWTDYPGHRERHEPAKLGDGVTNYWWCSSDFNCSVTAAFREEKTINEIHIHSCNINLEKYIPKVLTIELNMSGNYTTYDIVTNNTYYADYELSFPEEKTVTGVRIKDLHGKNINEVGEYDLPCIEEVEIFKARPTINTSVQQEVIQEDTEESFLEKLGTFLFGE